MLQRCFVPVAALATALLLATSSPATAQVTLKMKFPENSAWTTTATSKTKQSLVLLGMDNPSGSTQTAKVTTQTGQRDAEGKLQLSQSIDALKASVSLPGGIELEFDSSKPDAPAAGTQVDFVLDIFKAIAKSKWTETLNAQNRVIEVRGRDAVLEKLDETVRGMLADRFNEEYLIEQANSELDKIPSEPISPGDRWQRGNTIRLEAGQRLAFTTEYEYQGVVTVDGKSYDRINTKPLSVEYSVQGESPIQLKESDLKIAEGDGHMLFDRELGRVVYSEGKVRITGDITFVAGDQELPGKLDLTLENTSKQSS